jgi:hypothetical protein
MGQPEIEAEVIEMQTRAPIANKLRRLDTRGLEALGEFASFLEKTQLDKLCPDVNIEFSQPGGFARLLEHIVVHQYFLGLDYNREVTWEEAVTDWYHFLYKPITTIIAERNILREFPGRTEADLYLWITDHHWTLNQEELKHHDHDVGLDEAAEDFARKHSARLARKISRALKSWVGVWRGINAPASTASAGTPEPTLDILAVDLSKDQTADMIETRLLTSAPHT